MVCLYPQYPMRANVNCISAPGASANEAALNPRKSDMKGIISHNLACNWISTAGLALLLFAAMIAPPARSKP
jgi:hypothetical protein